MYKTYMATSRKVYSVRIDEQRMKQLKHVAVDTDKSLGTLLEEAIQDLLKKYEKNPPKPSK
jgi:predicted transcriptional regulator